MLIVFVSIAVLGVTVFIVEKLRQFDAEQVSARCIYSAQAGIHQAIYFFRLRDLAANGSFSLGQTNIDAGNFFTVGGTAADLLMVNTSTATTGGSGNRDFLNLRIQNATNSQTINIDRMVVTWNNTRSLRTIRINGSNVWTGNAVSPANADITNFTLNTTPTIYSIDFLRFSGGMAGATINIQFVMTDGTSRSLTVLPASQNYNFTVKSTGKTAGSNIYRTIQSDYNALTARIINYNEINTEIIP